MSTRPANIIRHEHTRATWLYAAQAEDVPLFKIGITVDLAKRLYALRLRRSYAIKIAWAFRLSEQEAAACEGMILARLNKRSVGADWFLISAGDLRTEMMKVLEEWKATILERFEEPL